MNKLYRNEYLFSELYLEEITNFVEKPEVTTSLQTLKEYKDFADKTDLNNWKTSFVQKVFGVLGFNYSSENENLIKLFKHGDRDNTITVCYTLLPVNDLDNAAIGKHWAEKIIRSLNDNNLDWGILTNGHKWRIYHGNEPNPNETYLEIDLENILDNTDTKNFMIFYEFMKADNFVKNEENKCSFDQFKKESFEKIAYIEDELKNALRQREGEGGKGVLNDLCMGYIEYLRSQGSTDFSEQSFRDDIYSSAMLYMFRLLFIFYSTARQLLNNEETEKFYNILNKSKSLLDSQSASHDSNELWLELRELFAIIEVHYNGGLFDPEEHSFIENTRISDFYISRVLYNMNFYKDNEGNERIISYRDMGVRHLGTLYEGLLEHRLFIASENTQVKLKKGEVKFIPESVGGAIVEGSYIPKGEVYFAGDKGERKSTGSYYTPEYIVDYIVTNTVGEKLKELKEEFINNNQSLFDDIKTAIDEGEKKRLTTYLEEQLLEFTKNNILKLSVLDPAMGSGHFLVNATNRIANFITAFLNEYELQSELSSSTTYWRRRVVENCIYGVDINPLAVELSKLSLWILSMAKDAHLSFLNHHLKCGNSLIGARLSDIGIYPDNKKKTKKGELSLWDKDENFKQTVEKVINDYFAIEERETKDKNDIEYKKDLLEDINEDLQQYKKICDFHTDVYLDETIDESHYFSKLKLPQTIDVENYSYFHWELEFPEILLQRRSFDCYVGNPPYIEYSSINPLDVNYLNQKYFSTRVSGKWNLYIIFIEKGIELISETGRFCMIIPNTFLAANYGKEIRKLVIQNHWLNKIIDVSKIKVFGDVATYPILFFLSFSAVRNEILLSYVNTEDDLIDTAYNKIPIRQLNDPKNDFVISTSFDTVNLNILEKIAYNKQPLKKLCKKFIWGSSITGFKSYKLSELEFQNLPDNLKSNFERVIQTADIKRYYIAWKREYVSTEIYTNRTINEFSKKKIVIARVTKRIQTAYDNEGFYLGKSSLITEPEVDIFYLLGLLNSKLINYFYHMKYENTHMAGGYLRFDIPYLKEIPVIVPRDSRSLTLVEYISNKVKDILKITGSKDTKTSEEFELLDNEINNLVFDLYDMDQNEISTIINFMS